MIFPEITIIYVNSRRMGTKKTRNGRRGHLSLNNKPIIITFLAMEKVILLCTYKTAGGRFGSEEIKIFCTQM